LDIQVIQLQLSELHGSDDKTEIGSAPSVLSYNALSLAQLMLENLHC
jgi:hypothetical protein